MKKRRFNTRAIHYGLLFQRMNATHLGPVARQVGHKAAKIVVQHLIQLPVPP